MFEDSFGKFWIGTEYGLHLFNRQKGSFQSYFSNRNNSFSLNGNSIKAIFEDKSGALWIGLDGRGLDKLNLKNRLFKHYYSNPKNSDKMCDHMVFALYEDRAGWLWVGTFGGGLNVYNRKTGEFKNYRNLPNNPKSISDNTIWAICEDKNDQIWIGTANAGVNRFSRKQGKFTRYINHPDVSDSLSNNSVSSIIEDREGNIWIATNGGIDRYLPETDSFTHYKHRVGIKDSLAHNVVFVLYEDIEGIIWAGTAGGISVLDPANNTFVNSSMLPAKNENIIHKPVFAISQDNTGIMWIGSIDGLIEYQPKTKKCLFYKKQNGLPNNVINGILKDDNGNLWISTNLGLSRYNILSGEFKNYSRHDGLQSFEFNGGAYYKSKKGELFFGGIRGFNSFFPETIKDNPYIPSVFITGLKVLGETIKIGEKFKGKVILKRSLLNTDEIILNYKQYSFSIGFVALNFIDAKNNKYAYKMEGIDENWNYIGKQRLVTFANLQPGKYLFKVKASNNNGVWNENGASIQIRIIPGFWQTTWFKLLLLVLLIFTIQLIVLKRNSLKKRRKQELEDIIAERTFDIRETKEKYQTVVETSTQGIIILKKEVIIFLNSQFSSMVGRNENRIINTKLNKFIKNSEFKKFKSFFYDSDFSKQTIGKFETILINDNGIEINVEINYNIIEYKNSPAILMFFQNINFKKLLEEERLKIARLESTRNIAKGISHDYNNLLAIILGYLGFALEKVKKGSVIHTNLLKIQNAGNTAANLTKQFLFISGSGDSQKKAQSIISTLRGITGDLMDNPNIVCQLDISPDLWDVNCNLDDLSQVFKNIITNSIQSMGESKKLEVEATNQKTNNLQIQGKPFEKYARISFKDNGHGISKEDLPNIFDPYFSTRKNVTQKGLGLGLAVVNVIILQHQGFIHVESELEKGTTVNIFLPASQKAID
jgi:PAS domain S-box-containing protein